MNGLSGTAADEETTQTTQQITEQVTTTTTELLLLRNEIQTVDQKIDDTQVKLDTLDGKVTGTYFQSQCKVR